MLNWLTGGSVGLQWRFVRSRASTFARAMQMDSPVLQMDLSHIMADTAHSVSLVGIL